LTASEGVPVFAVGRFVIGQPKQVRLRMLPIVFLAMNGCQTHNQRDDLTWTIASYG
jgi:hypothetical protein